jgi:ABC-type multidrug transport system fused ATPase/permease subunit
VTASTRTTFQLLRPHAQRHVGAFALLLLLGAITAFAQRSIVMFIAPGVDVLFPKGASAAAAPAPPSAFPIVDYGRGLARQAHEWLVGDPSTDAGKIQALDRLAFALLAVAIVASVSQYLFLVISRRVAITMVVDLRTRIARHLMGLSMAYHGRRHFGDLLSRLSSDTTTTLNVLNQCLKELVQEPLMGGASLAIAAFIAPVPTLFVALGLVVIAVPVARQARKVRKGSTKSLTSLGSSVQALSQMFQGIRAVKAFRAEERELEGYSEINRSYVRTTMKLVRAQALSQASTMLLSFAGMAGLVLVVGWLRFGKGGTFNDEKDLAMFFVYVSAMYASLKDVVRAITVVQESVGASERIQALLDERTDVVERPRARTVQGIGSGLRFEGVSFAYPGGDGNAIVDFDLHLRPGETVALVGPSGGGKSTVVDLVARFIDPVTGRVTVDGLDLRDLTLDSWTAQYAMVGQTPFLFHTSIGENIKYGKPDASQNEVEGAARAAGIHDFIVSLPDGYATNVADAGSRLSGGQRQRITIARAFLKGAPLLLLDEATSALDTESEKVVQAALERLMSQRTVLVIAHRLSTVRRADRIAVLDRGRLVEIGTHDELLARNGLYAKLHAMQFQDETPPTDPRGEGDEEDEETSSLTAPTSD